MLRHIERLRTKPKAVRIQVAFLSALVLTSLVAVVWLVSIPSQVADMRAALTSEATAETTNRSYWRKLQTAIGFNAIVPSALTPATSPTATSATAFTNDEDDTPTPTTAAATATPEASTQPAGRVILIATTSTHTTATTSTTSVKAP